MKLFFILIRREFKLFGSNSLAVLIFIGAPILYALLVGSVYNQATVKDLPILVVDLDNSPLSNKVIDALDDNMYIKVAEVKNIQDNIRDEVIKNNYQGVVTIPAGFEGDIQQKRYTEIDADINGSNMLTANYATTGIQLVLSTLNAGIEIETLKKKGIASEIAQQQFEAFKVNITRFFNSSSNYLLFLWPGMLGTVMQQVFLLALALSFAKEFEENTFRNLIRYSKKASYLLAVKSIPYWLMGIALWLPLIRGYFALFHVNMMPSLGAFYLASALFILSLTFMGISASIIFNSQLKATEVLMIIAVPSFIISGQTWPLSQMPHVIQWIAQFIPLTHYLEAFRKLMMYNASFSEISTQIHSLLWLSLVYLAIAFVALRFRINKQKSS
jgi:ABC-2 type transport system permease protein